MCAPDTQFAGKPGPPIRYIVPVVGTKHARMVSSNADIGIAFATTLGDAACTRAIGREPALTSAVSTTNSVTDSRRNTDHRESRSTGSTR